MSATRLHSNIISVISYLYKLLILGFAVAATLMTSQGMAFAGANLMVTPSRIVFEGRTRTAQVTLLNTGDEAGSFRISFIRQQMTEGGQFVQVKENETGLFSDPMVRYSPRQITLPPGQSQVIRLMLRKPRALEDGEYRSHLLFQSIPKSSKSSIASAVTEEQKGISVEIIPVVGISIPVIVREGNLASTLKLDNAQVIPATGDYPLPRISVDMERSGNRSVYGDFRILFTPDSGGETVTIGLVNGVAVYTPNLLRRFSLDLRMPKNVMLQNGKLRILFLESGKDEKTGLIAETTVNL